MAIKSGPSAELGAFVPRSLSFLETGPFCYCSSSGVCVLSFLLKLLLLLFKEPPPPSHCLSLGYPGGWPRVGQGRQPGTRGPKILHRHCPVCLTSGSCSETRKLRGLRCCVGNVHLSVEHGFASLQGWQRSMWDPVRSTRTAE